MPKRWAAPARYGSIFVEQAFIGFGNFFVSWTAIRTFSTGDVATFALAWAISWGLFAVIAEAVLTPLRVAFAQHSDSSDLKIISRTVSWLSLLLIVTSVVFLSFQWELMSITTGVMTVPAAGVAFYMSRAASEPAAMAKIALTRGFVYALCSLIFVEAVSLGGLGPGAFLIAGSSSLLVASFVGRLSKPSLADIGIGGTLFARQMWSGKIFGLSTGLRVALYSVGLLALIRVSEGSYAAAIYAAAFVLISPSQLVTTSVPWVLLPRLANSAVSVSKFQKETFLQLGIYGALSLLSSIAFLLIWPWWVHISIADSGLRNGIGGSPYLVTALMVGIILTSWCSTVLQALRAQKSHLASVVVGGVAAGLVVVSGGDVLIAAATPYWISFLLALLLIAIHLTKGRNVT
jgi:hypothetical protein